MEFISNVNITMEEYNTLKETEKKYNEFKKAIKWSTEDVRTEEDGKIVLNRIHTCTVNKEKIEEMIYKPYSNFSSEKTKVVFE